MTGALRRTPSGAIRIDEALQLDVPDELVDALTPGQHIHHGQYLIHGVLGRGSFATVYDAEHLGLARRVAVKVPLLQVEKKALLHERFLREARTSALVQHPNVLAIYDAGSLLDGTPFLVLERVDGDSLNERIAHGPLPIELVIEIGRQLALALSALAAAGIVHRDIKPANVMLHREASSVVPRVKLVDLGIAKRRSAWQQPLPLTMQGELIGTPQYMASEQLRGEEVDGRTDIYGAAAVLYEALTGKPPHESHSISEFMVAALCMPVLPIRALRADCPPSLERTLLRALQRDREQRQASAEHLLAELETCKAELETSEIELEDDELELLTPVSFLRLREASAPLDPAPDAAAPSDIEPRRELTPAGTTQLLPALEPAPQPLVASAHPPPLSQVRKAGTSARAQAEDALRAGARAPSWLVASERALPSGPRRIGLALLLLSLGGSGALVLPGASQRDESVASASPSPVLDDSDQVVLTNDTSGSVGATVVSSPAQPFAPRVEQLRDEAPAALVESALRQPGPLPGSLAPEPGAKPHGAGSSAPLRATPAATPARRARPAQESAVAPRHAAQPARAGSETPPAAAPVEPARAVADQPADSAAAQTPTSASGQSAKAQASPAADTSTQAALADALKAFTGGRLADAEAVYAELLRGDAHNTAALRGLGLVAARRGETDVARKALRRYLELAPGAPDAAQISSRVAALAP